MKQKRYSKNSLNKPNQVSRVGLLFYFNIILYICLKQNIMNANISLKLFNLTKEFIKDEAKAQEFVAKIEQTIDEKFITKTENLASKTDLSATESRLNKTIYIVGLVQFLAIVGSVLAIVNFMLK